MRIPLSGLIVIVLCFVSAWSCKKTIDENLHIDTVITGNQTPPYDGVSDVEVDNYINKIYIDLIGREPTTNELAADHLYLEQNNLDDTSRDYIISELMATEEYYYRLFDLAADEFINGTDTFTIQYEIDFFYFVWYLDSLNGNTQNYIAYFTEINKLESLLAAGNNLMNGSISINEFYATFLFNYFYDEVNMGSENFVKGAFDDLYRRAPTESELENGITMIDNAPAILFLESGDSKGDFVNIVTSCQEFYEGLVLKTYEQLLQRDPDSEEMGTYSLELQNTGDFPAFQKEVMKSEEYAGF